jgi:hypothetical protein
MVKMRQQIAVLLAETTEMSQQMVKMSQQTVDRESTVKKLSVISYSTSC